MDQQTEPTAIFNKNFLSVACINLFIMVAYYMLFVISSPYAAERFGASPSMSGLVAGVMLIGCLAGRFVTGHLITIAGFRKVLFAGIIIYTGSIALYFAAGSLPVLLFVRLVSGIGIGFIGTSTGTIVAYSVPAAQRGLGISYFSMSTILGLAMGPFLGISLMRLVGFNTLFLLCAACGGVSFLLALGLSMKDPCKTADRCGTSLFSLDNYIDKKVLPFALVVMAVCLCWGNVQAFMSFFASEAGLVEAAGFFFLCYAVVVLASRPYTGRLLDKRGENVVVYPAIFLTALGLVILATSHQDWQLLLAGCVVGAGFGNFQSTGQVISLKLVPRHRFGQATSTYFIFLDFGIGLGPYLSGFLVPHAGYRGMYMASAVVALIAVPLYWLAHGRKAAGGDSAPEAGHPA